MSLGINDLHKDYAAARRTPLDVFEEVCAHILAADAPAHVFTTTTLARAYRAAQASTRRWREGQPLGYLDGIPIVWKDLFDMVGVVTSCCSLVREHATPAQQDAELVRQMESLGVISVGKTTMSEFAYSGLGISPYPGTPRNPVDSVVERISGGSSSGSAVAVALGWVSCGMGSDTSGSIRVPAAFQGLVGFRPTHGRYPTQGMYPLAPSMDTAGPLTRSVTDVCLLDAALTGQIYEQTQSLRNWIFIVPGGHALAQTDDDVQAAFESAIACLAHAGATITTRVFEAYEMTRQLFDQYGTLVAVEATTVHYELMKSPEFDKVDARIAARMRKGAALPPVNRHMIQRSRAALVRMAKLSLAPREILIYPTVAMTAPALAPLEQDDELFADCNLRVLHNTMLSSYLNMPTLSLPAGLTKNGLPFGVSLTLTAGQDTDVMRVGLAVQQALTQKPSATI